jgi:hypothetical protein
MMAAESAAIFGIVVTPASMEAAIGGLKSAGFSSAEVSILMSDKGGWHDFVGSRSAHAATGVEVGGVVGGAVGLILGLGVLFIPGVGPLVAAGPIMASLAGLGVGGALGGLVGALVDMGVPEYEARLYDDRLKQGAVLLSIRCVSLEQFDRARSVLTTAGAEDIASSGEDEMQTPSLEAPAIF